MSGPHETWFEKLMREAQDAGEFDDLPGAGKPIEDLRRSYDPAWWARSWMARESVAEAARETSARVRRELPRILAGSDEDQIAGAIGDLNADIRAVNERLPDADRLPMLDAVRLIADRVSRRRDS